MNKQYWSDFYKNKHELKPTLFAEWCLDKIPKKSFIFDLGCGNGRDSYYFATQGHHVAGIDYAVQPADKANVRDKVSFYKLSIDELTRGLRPQETTVIYSRFFLHSITGKEINKLLKWSRGVFMAEFRSDKDEPMVYKNHKRNLINANEILIKLMANGFQVVYFMEGQGLAPYKTEDPVVIRLIATKAV